MKQILVVIAALCVLIMTACSSKKNTMDSKVDKPPGIDNDVTSSDTSQDVDAECDPPETEQIIGTETSPETTAVMNEPVTTEAVTVFTETLIPIVNTPPISSETSTAQKPPDKLAVATKSPPPSPPTDATAAANTETSISTEPAPEPQLSIEDIRAMCVRVAQSMGYTQNTALTPENSAWWNPVAVSVTDKVKGVERSLTEYIHFHTPDNLAAYGLGEITCFNIYAERQEKGVYRIYFLFA